MQKEEYIFILLIQVKYKLLNIVALLDIVVCVINILISFEAIIISYYNLG